MKPTTQALYTNTYYLYVGYKYVLPKLRLKNKLPILDFIGAYQT